MPLIICFRLGDGSIRGRSAAGRSSRGFSPGRLFEDRGCRRARHTSRTRWAVHLFNKSLHTSDEQMATSQEQKGEDKALEMEKAKKKNLGKKESEREEIF